MVKDILSLMRFSVYDSIEELKEAIKNEINPDTIDITNDTIQFTKGEKVYIVKISRPYVIEDFEEK